MYEYTSLIQISTVDSRGGKANGKCNGNSQYIKWVALLQLSFFFLLELISLSCIENPFILYFPAGTQQSMELCPAAQLLVPHTRSPAHSLSWSQSP